MSMAMGTALKGTVHGKTVELDQQVDRLDGQRVFVVLEPIDEPALSAAETAEAWRTWAPAHASRRCHACFLSDHGCDRLSMPSGNLNKSPIQTKPIVCMPTGRADSATSGSPLSFQPGAKSTLREP
jgi:hypothetical protein